MAREAIAGVTPSATQETTIVTVWPSIALYDLGQAMGRLFQIRWPDWHIFRLGNLLALLCIPLAVALYFLRIAPKHGTRYRLTNRRVIVERGLQGLPQRSIGLDEFDAVRADQRPGQQWYDAADVVFTRGTEEVFRLGGVSRHEPWIQTCQDAHQARRLVAQVHQQQAASVA